MPKLSRLEIEELAIRVVAEAAERRYIEARLQLLNTRLRLIEARRVPHDPA